MANYSFPVPPVEVSPLDDMVLGIHPVHPMPCIVDGQSVGPEEVRVRNDTPIRAIHVGILDAGSVAPVSPVDSAGEGKEKRVRKLMSYVMHTASLPIRAKHYRVTSNMRPGPQPWKKQQPAVKIWRLQNRTKALKAPSTSRFPKLLLSNKGLESKGSLSDQG